MGVKESILSITQPSIAVSHTVLRIANQITNLRQQSLKVTKQKDSKQQILTLTANSERLAVHDSTPKRKYSCIRRQHFDPPQST